MHQLIQYIKFLLKSTNQHGVHSPFVYTLVTNCFYDKKQYDDYELISNYRTSLLNNHNKINVTDLGAGSRVMKHQERCVSIMAKNAGSTRKRAQLLYRITKYFEALNILELGTSLGISTLAMALGNRNAKLLSIEGCPNISEFTKANLKSKALNNFTIITGDFDNIIEELAPCSYDLIFFDGNHQKEATIHYFELLIESVHNDSVFIFDDIYWSKGMTEAWEAIKQHPKVTVTVDTFYWGFVFFRKEQAKEHFTIRV